MPVVLKEYGKDERICGWKEPPREIVSTGTRILLFLLAILLAAFGCHRWCAYAGFGILALLYLATFLEGKRNNDYLRWLKEKAEANEALCGELELELEKSGETLP